MGGFIDSKNKFIVDGKLTIKIHGIFKFELFQVPSVEQRWKGGNLGDELWKEDKSKDFTIIVEKNEIKVHKLVVGARSDVFTRMFDSKMKESLENKVELTDFSFEVVETAIKLVYECNFISALSIQNAMLLLQFLDKYNLSTSKEDVENYLINQISAKTVCTLTNCSRFTNSPKLNEKCLEFLKVCFAAEIDLYDTEILDKDIDLKDLQSSLCYTIVQNK
uniref:BTB domain-containing protein n=1 Tax=Panagrolaimus sp. ES5 TaxID=591445 RepID=A0AC34FDF9_9BILA